MILAQLAQQLHAGMSGLRDVVLWTKYDRPGSSREITSVGRRPIIMLHEHVLRYGAIKVETVIVSSHS